MLEEETETTAVEDLFYKSKDYVNTRIELFKLKGINKASNVFASTVTAIFLVVMGLMALVLFSIGLALYLGEILGASHYGFFIVGGLYIIIGLILIALRKQLLKIPFSNWLIKNLID